MQSNSSVSQGIFLFKNGFKRKETRKKSTKNISTAFKPSILNNTFYDQLWYESYNLMWKKIQEDIENLQLNSHLQVIDELVDYVVQANKNLNELKLPTVALLTGVNQPDHFDQFRIIADKIKLKVPNTCLAICQARDCHNVKSSLETIVSHLMKCDPIDGDNEDDDDDDLNDSNENTYHLRRSKYTIHALKQWYKEKCSNQSDRLVLTIILPDIELFNSDVLEKLLLLLCNCMSTIRICLILGLATSISTMHSILPYNVINKLNMNVVKMDSSIVLLEKILNNIILTPKYPFLVSGKIFQLLTNIFLCFDLSLNGFIQGFKYCLMDHFSQGNSYSLCSFYKNSMKYVNDLTHSDIETIRRLPSFRPYVESLTDCREIIDILTDDEYFKKKLPKLLENNYINLTMFHCVVRILLSLVADMPNSPLGKQLRDLYATCQQTTINIVDNSDFLKCWEILSISTTTAIIGKLNKCCDVINEFTLKFLTKSNNVNNHCLDATTEIINGIKKFIVKLENVNGQTVPQTQPIVSRKSLPKFDNRNEFREKLMAMKTTSSVSDHKLIINEALNYLKCDVIAKYILPINNRSALYELFFYSNFHYVKKHIIGAPRSAIDTALNNPQLYLQCNCCTLENSKEFLPTLPDLSIAYKLHLESCRSINLFDWLQSFKTVISPDDNDDMTNLDPIIQASFTRAVGELQFLGFIKSSTKKTDHVTRLTW